ncbi:MAG TPA: thioredoxin family protein [Polyangiaceae bacterium]|nr:thioredoxin family protein [Polyangiaceae bacterium]
MFRNRLASALLPLLLGALGCEAGAAPGTSRTAPKPTALAAKAPNPVAPVPVAAAPPPAPAKNGVEFRGNVEWHTWEEGLAIAAKESKPIFVLVYADWCPHCRELGPVFADPRVEALSKRFVMVRQNHDDDPPWLQPYNQKYGQYVPRIFFFNSKGQIREDVTSGHPRYPYFYAAEHAELLTASMQRVAGS